MLKYSAQGDYECWVLTVVLVFMLHSIVLGLLVKCFNGIKTEKLSF